MDCLQAEKEQQKQLVESCGFLAESAKTLMFKFRVKKNLKKSVVLE